MCTCSIMQYLNACISHTIAKIAITYPTMTFSMTTTKFFAVSAISGIRTHCFINNRSNRKRHVVSVLISTVSFRPFISIAIAGSISRKALTYACIIVTCTTTRTLRFFDISISGCWSRCTDNACCPPTKYCDIAIKVIVIGYL